ncbi:lipopolysaccharide biosynthesis protein [Bacillus paranthracis]
MEYALGSGIVLVLGFISSPLNTRLFTPEEFGKFSLFLLIANVINAIVLMGLDQSFVRYFHEEEKSNRGILLYKNLKIPILFCLVLCICIAIVYKKIAYEIFATENLDLLVLLILNNVFMLLNRFGLLVIRMQQKGKLYSYVQIIQKVSNIILIVVFFMGFKNNFIALVYAFVLSNVIVTIYAMYKEKRILDVSEQKNRIKNKRFGAY